MFMRIAGSGWWRCCLLAVLVVSGSCGIHAQETRGDLMFALNSAVKQRDAEAILGCFDFDGVDDATRITAERAVEKICQWPTSYVFTSERSGTGPLRSERDGRVWTLNGDWQFQVHIFLKKPPSKGYVFPAGLAKGGEKPRFAILLLTPAP